jgi:hypothetical protein
MTNDGKCLSHEELLCGPLVARLASVDIKPNHDIPP